MSELNHPLNPNAVTYSSSQATECAVCRERKHTPLRRDEMGGYVCLTCIDKRLDKFELLPDNPFDSPVRSGYSRDEIYEHAKTFMVETYGPVRESPDKDKWHERFGFLLSFLHDRFPSNEVKS